MEGLYRTGGKGAPDSCPWGPGVVIYNCEWHIAHSGEEKLRPDELGGAYASLVEVMKHCVQGPSEWSELEAAVAALPDVPPPLANWMRRQRRALPRLWARRQRDMPRGAGPLEEFFDELNRSFHHRRFRFRNLGRLERVLALMLLADNGVANERRYAQIITAYLESDATDFRAAVGRWRRLADPKPTGSSVRELAKRAAERIAAEKSLEDQRQLNRRLARAWQQGQRIFS